MTGTGRLRRLAGIVAGAIVVLVVGILTATGSLNALEHSTVDQRFQIRGAKPVSDVAVVGIDAKTFWSMNITWPMRRRLHAEMIDALRKAGVRRIVYDVQFTEPSDHPNDDLQLFDAVGRAKGTILATGDSDSKGRTGVLGGDKALASIGARAADGTFPSDSGGVIRRYRLRNAKLETIAAATAESVGHPVPAKGFDASASALIDFRGPGGTIPNYSFSDVLAGKIDPAKLRGRIVVVGATAPVLQDIHPTGAPGKRLMPGPEIQANAIWTAVHGNPLRALPSGIGLLLLVAFGLTATALVVRFGVLRALAGVVALAILYFGAAILAFDHGTVVPVAAPLIALCATYAVVALIAVTGEIALRAHLSRYSAQLERDVQARTAELVETQLEVVLRLARAAELRDDDTGEHIDRMSEMCGEVARELGFSEADAVLLRHAAALHDIGKIGVPDAILLKPGRLTDAEFDVMRRHVAEGAELLAGSDSPVLVLAETVARTHHEKWDGTGYPSGTVADDIPLVGRIAAACDVFDALTHERPYKQAWTIEDACAEIGRCRGHHFDPTVADALIAVVERQHGPIARPAPRLAA